MVAQLLRRNTPDELDAVVISHMHTDHCLDLVTLRYCYPWIDVAKKRLLVIVPPGATAQLAEMALGAGYMNFFDKSFIFVEHDGKRPDRGRQPAPGAGRDAALRAHLGLPHQCPRDRREPGSRSSPTRPMPVHARRCRASRTSADLFLCEAGLRSLVEDDPEPQSRGHLLPSEAGRLAREAGAQAPAADPRAIA